MADFFINVSTSFSQEADSDGPLVYIFYCWDRLWPSGFPIPCIDHNLVKFGTVFQEYRCNYFYKASPAILRLLKPVFLAFR